MPRLSHVGEDGSARMVDVSAKPVSTRTATASGRIKLNRETLALIAENKIAKGNVFATARIAGILSHVDLELSLGDEAVEVTCTARTAAQTGVEMEALTGVALALLTIYDMCKAVDKEMEISGVRLLSKTKTN